MDSLLNELHTIESEDRLGFKSPVFLITVIILYLIFVYSIGPRFMKNRQPYKLNGFISLYNIFQIMACIYLIRQIWQLTSWEIFDFSKCKLYEENTRDRKFFDDLTYFGFCLKIFELSDTVLFVLRKKSKQVTYLHVFHHASAVTLFYFLLRYYRGNGALYPIFLNCWVHVIMYSYYLVTNAYGSNAIKGMIYIKKTITIIQMVQFVFVLYHAMFMWTTCKVPLILTAYYCVVISVIFYGFYDFYKKAYHKAQSAKSVQ